MKLIGDGSSQLGAIALPNGNAYQWAVNAARSTAKALGVTVDGTPTVNSIAQKTFSPKAGHVAVVESVNADGTITVTESSYSNDTASVWNFLWHHRTCATNWFSNYIHVTLPPTIATTSLVNATSNVTYTATLQLNPGTGIAQFKWSWVVQSGSKLPSVAGLSLNPTTGVISGTPKKTGTFSFTVKVTDAKKQTATQPLTLTIGN